MNKKHDKNVHIQVLNPVTPRSINQEITLFEFVEHRMTFNH